MPPFDEQIRIYNTYYGAPIVRSNWLTAEENNSESYHPLSLVQWMRVMESLSGKPKKAKRKKWNHEQ